MHFRHSFFALALAVTGLTFTSCKDNDPVNPNVITEDYYFQAVIDGDTVTYQEGIEDYVNIIGDMSGLDAANGWCYTPFTCIAKNAAATNGTPANLANSGTVGVVGVTSSQVASLSAYEALVSTGTLQIGRIARDTGQTAVSGAFISIWDDSGVEWNTDNGPLGTGSLVITEYTAEADNSRLPASHRIVGATFNCTVYNSTGQSKEITGGRIRGRLITW